MGWTFLLTGKQKGGLLPFRQGKEVEGRKKLSGVSRLSWFLIHIERHAAQRLNLDLKKKK